jgi:hypothetical protein
VVCRTWVTASVIVKSEKVATAWFRIAEVVPIRNPAPEFIAKIMLLMA